MSASTATVYVSQERHVATVEIARPPHNFFNLQMITEMASTLEALDADPTCRCIVLAAQGTTFCAGADFRESSLRSPTASAEEVNPLYLQALRLFSVTKPIVVAVQGAAIGGGLGLSLVGDFRVSCAEARFAANFTCLGIHPGFGLTVTLPRLVGIQQAARMFYRGERIAGHEAHRIGLVDELVERNQVREAASRLAASIAASAPLAVASTRMSLRFGLVEAIRAAVVRESAEQFRLFRTEDFAEGLAAAEARREAEFKGR